MIRIYDSSIGILATDGHLEFSPDIRSLILDNKIRKMSRAIGQNETNIRKGIVEKTINPRVRIFD
jgi:hypothetical protein